MGKYEIINIDSSHLEACKPVVLDAIEVGKAKGTDIKELMKLADECINYGVSIGAEVDGDIIAVLFMHKAYMTGSSTHCVYYDDIFYVQPAYRSSPIARELVQTAVLIGAGDEEVERVVFGSLNAHSREEARGWEWIMKSSGLQEGGKIYMAEVGDGQ